MLLGSSSSRRLHVFSARAWPSISSGKRQLGSACSLLVVLLTCNVPKFSQFFRGTGARLPPSRGPSVERRNGFHQHGILLPSKGGSEVSQANQPHHDQVSKASCGGCPWCPWKRGAVYPLVSGCALLQSPGPQKNSKMSRPDKSRKTPGRKVTNE